MIVAVGRNGRVKFCGVKIPDGWEVEKSDHHPTYVHVIKIHEGERSVATICWKERTVDTGWTGRYRKYREEVPKGKGWMTKLVEQAIRALGGTT